MSKVLIALGFVVFGLSTVAGAQNVEFLNPPELNKPNGFSHVVVVNRGRVVFISGQAGVDKDGKVAGDFAAQARCAFANLKRALAAARASPADLVKLTFYVAGLNGERLAALREARDSVVDKDHPPASTLLGVQALFRHDVLVEIDAVAVVP